MNRKLLVFLILFAIALIVAYRLSGWEFDWALFFSSFRDVQAGWLVLSVVFTLSTYLIRAFRWQVLLAPMKAIRVHPLLVSTLVGFSAIYIIGRAGEVVRPMWLARQAQVPMTSSIATIVVERFLDSLFLLLMFAWTLIFVDTPQGANAGRVLDIMQNAAWVLLLVSVGAMAAMYLFRSNIEAIKNWIPSPRLESMLHNFGEGLAFMQHGRGFVMALAYSLALWIAVALQFWFMVLGMNFDLTISSATLVMVGTAIGSIAQVPGIGGGFQAGFIFCMATFFDVPAERSAAASLIAWVLSYIPTIGVSALYMLITGISFRDLRVQSEIHNPKSEIL